MTADLATITAALARASLMVSAALLVLFGLPALIQWAGGEAAAAFLPAVLFGWDQRTLAFGFALGGLVLMAGGIAQWLRAFRPLPPASDAADAERIARARGFATMGVSTTLYAGAFLAAWGGLLLRT